MPNSDTNSYVMPQKSSVMGPDCVFISIIHKAQWENECISLSVLSVAPVMIAQWENECISLSVLSAAWFSSRLCRSIFF